MEVDDPSQQFPAAESNDLFQGNLAMPTTLLIPKTLTLGASAKSQTPYKFLMKILCDLLFDEIQISTHFQEESGSLHNSEAFRLIVAREVINIHALEGFDTFTEDDIVTKVESMHFLLRQDSGKLCRTADQLTVVEKEGQGNIELFSSITVPFSTLWRSSWLLVCYFDEEKFAKYKYPDQAKFIFQARVRRGTTWSKDFKSTEIKIFSKDKRYHVKSTVPSVIRDARGYNCPNLHKTALALVDRSRIHYGEKYVGILCETYLPPLLKDAIIRVALYFVNPSNAHQDITDDISQVLINCGAIFSGLVSQMMLEVATGKTQRGKLQLLNWNTLTNGFPRCNEVMILRRHALRLTRDGNRKEEMFMIWPKSERPAGSVPPKEFQTVRAACEANIDSDSIKEMHLKVQKIEAHLARMQEEEAMQRRENQLQVKGKRKADAAPVAREMSIVSARRMNAWKAKAEVEATHDASSAVDYYTPLSLPKRSQKIDVEDDVEDAQPSSSSSSSSSSQRMPNSFPLSSATHAPFIDNELGTSVASYSGVVNDMPLATVALESPLKRSRRTPASSYEQAPPPSLRTAYGEMETVEGHAMKLGSIDFNIDQNTQSLDYIQVRELFKDLLPEDNVVMQDKVEKILPTNINHYPAGAVCFDYDQLDGLVSYFDEHIGVNDHSAANMDCDIDDLFADADALFDGALAADEAAMET